MGSIAEVVEEKQEKVLVEVALSSEFEELRLIEPQLCVYCGMPADSIDHVIPQKMRLLLADVGGWRKRWPRITDKVWACRQCNSAATDFVFDTLEQKRRCIHRHYRRKYAHVLRMPEWTDSELASLGPNMREYVIQSWVNAEWVRDRLAWPRRRHVGAVSEGPD